MPRSYRETREERRRESWGQSYAEHRSVSPSRHGSGFFTAATSMPSPLPSGPYPPPSRRMSAYESSHGGYNSHSNNGNIGGGSGGGGGYGQDDVEDQLHDLRSRQMHMQSQLQSKDILIEEHKDQIGSLKDHISTLERTLRTKHEEGELLENAMENLNQQHAQSLGGHSAHDLLSEVGRLEQMLKTSHAQGKNLYGDYKKLLEEFEEKEGMLKESRMMVDNLQRERADLIRGGVRHNISTPAPGMPTHALNHPPQQQQQPYGYPEPPPPEIAAAEQNKANNPGANSAVMSFSPIRAREETRKPQLSRDKKPKDISLGAAAKAAGRVRRASAPTEGDNNGDGDLRGERNRALQKVAEMADRLRASEEKNRELSALLKNDPPRGTSRGGSVSPGKGGGGKGHHGDLPLSTLNVNNILAMETENQVLTGEVERLRQGNKRLLHLLEEQKAQQHNPRRQSMGNTEDTLSASDTQPGAIWPALSQNGRPWEVKRGEGDGAEIAQLYQRILDLEGHLADHERMSKENRRLQEEKAECHRILANAEADGLLLEVPGRTGITHTPYAKIVELEKQLTAHEDVVREKRKLQEEIAGYHRLLAKEEEGPLGNLASYPAPYKRIVDLENQLKSSDDVSRENKALKDEIAAFHRTLAKAEAGGGVDGFAKAPSYQRMAAMETQAANHEHVLRENRGLKAEIAECHRLLANQEGGSPYDPLAATVPAQGHHAPYERLAELEHQLANQEYILRENRALQDEIAGCHKLLAKAEAEMAAEGVDDRMLQAVQDNTAHDNDQLREEIAECRNLLRARHPGGGGGGGGRSDLHGGAKPLTAHQRMIAKRHENIDRGNAQLKEKLAECHRTLSTPSGQGPTLSPHQHMLVAKHDDAQRDNMRLRNEIADCHRLLAEAEAELGPDLQPNDHMLQALQSNTARDNDHLREEIAECRSLLGRGRAGLGYHTGRQGSPAKALTPHQRMVAMRHANLEKGNTQLKQELASLTAPRYGQGKPLTAHHHAMVAKHDDVERDNLRLRDEIAECHRLLEQEEQEGGTPYRPDANHQRTVQENEALKEQINECHRLLAKAEQEEAGDNGEVNSMLMERNRQLIQEVEQLRNGTDRREYDEDNAALMNEVERLRSLLDLTESPEEVERMRHLIESMGEQLSELAQTSKAKEDHMREVETLNRELKAYQQEVALLNAELNKESRTLSRHARQAMADLEDKVYTLVPECQTLEEQLNRPDSELTEEDKNMLVLEVKKLTEQAVVLTKKTERAKEQLAHENRQSEPSGDRILSVIRDLGTSNAVLHEECTYLRGVLTDRSSDKTDSMLGDLQKQIVNLQKQLVNQDDEKKRHNDALTEDNENLKQTLRDAQAHLKTSKGDYQALKDQLLEAEEDNDYLKEQLAHYPEEVKELKHTIESLQNANQLMQKQSHSTQLTTSQYHKMLTKNATRLLFNKNKAVALQHRFCKLRDYARLSQARRRAYYIISRHTKYGVMHYAYRQLYLNYVHGKQLALSNAADKNNLVHVLQGLTRKGVMRRAYNKLMQFSFAMREQRLLDQRPDKRYLVHVLAGITRKGILRTAYSKLQRYYLEQKNQLLALKCTDRRNVLHVLQGLTRKGVLRRTYNKLRDHMNEAKRRNDNMHWLNILWQTKAQASEKYCRQHKEMLARRYYNKLAEHQRQAAKRRRRKIALETLGSMTSRGKLAVAYSKLAAYARLRAEERKRRRVQDSVLDSLAVHSDAAVRRKRYLALKRYADMKQRERETKRRQTLNLQSAELMMGTTTNSFIRVYYAKWLRFLRHRQDLQRHRKSAELLMGGTKKGMLRYYMSRLQAYASARKQDRARNARRDTILHALSTHNDTLVLRRSYGKMQGYTARRREEGFYWRHQASIERIGNCLRTATERGLMAKHYAKLRDHYYNSRKGSQGNETLSHLLLSQTTNGLMRVYYYKLLRYMKNMQRADAKACVASALLSGTHRTSLLRSLLMLAAYAVRGRKRHTRIISTAAMFPLRLVAGGHPDATLPRDRSSPPAHSPPRRESRKQSTSDPQSVPPPSFSPTDQQARPRTHRPRY